MFVKLHNILKQLCWLVDVKYGVFYIRNNYCAYFLGSFSNCCYMGQYCCWVTTHIVHLLFHHTFSYHYHSFSGFHGICWSADGVLRLDSALDCELKKCFRGMCCHHLHSDGIMSTMTIKWYRNKNWVHHISK